MRGSNSEAASPASDRSAGAIPSEAVRVLFQVGAAASNDTVLRDVQKALSQVDVSSLDANGLAAVGQILSTAAYWLSAAQTSSGPVS